MNKRKRKQVRGTATLSGHLSGHGQVDIDLGPVLQSVTVGSTKLTVAEPPPKPKVEDLGL